MTILWVPHSPFSEGAVRRDQHLIRHLCPEHRVISVTWESGRDGVLTSFSDGLRFHKESRTPGHVVYHIRRIPDITRRFRSRKRDAMWVNEALFRHDLRKIVKNERVDILITAYSAYMTGFPPFDLSIPVVFDYLDCAEWTSSNPHVRPYIEKSDLVLAVSALAQEQAERFNDDVVYLPNGADVQLLREASGHEIRDQYDLRDATVVSLIGLMDSEYLIDAVLAAKEEMPKLKCLLVGHSRFLQSAIESNPDASDTFVYAGPVPYSKVAKYFAASDIGLYPVPGISYDDGRSPIKIFEYTAAGCPVVAPPIREVQRLGFSNVITARPEARAFAEGILQAAEHNGSSEPTVDRYDWKYLSEKLEATLQDLLLFQGV